MDKKANSKKVKYFIAFLFVCIAFGGFFYKNKLDTRERSFDLLIIQASVKHSIEPELIKAVIKRESSFRYNIRGDHGEYGLMQITEGAAKDWERINSKTLDDYDQLLEPDINIEIGTWYLATAQKKWKNWNQNEALALAQYNAGGKNAKKWAPKNKNDSVIDKITFPSTKQYVKDVLEYKKHYQQNWKRK